ncbi:unnamed protein product [Paramecium pentaurelia]|uniref:Uncharacterized protein n=1 Tax=Paramecium pentaurelia TaxID=43138 RepID=A0A8S1X9D1_9CILI|nr:unnamed protein product [Paramecium pentaurelia]
MKLIKPITLGIQNCIRILMNLQNIINVKNYCQIWIQILRSLAEQQNQIKIHPQQQCNQNQQQILQIGEIKLKLIDQSIKQIIKCNAIFLDSSGSIMFSQRNNQINNSCARTQQLDLMFSLQQEKNSFVSGGGDMSIRCWQRLDQTIWISYIYHRDFLSCILLNSNEDLLFSGSDNGQIIVWKASLNENKLSCFYSLDQHNNSA